MKALPIITDPVAKKVENPGFLARFFLKRLSDERDMPFVDLCLKITFVLLPSAALLFVNPYPAAWMFWTHVVLHAFLILYFAAPFTLMLHNTSHRMFFKQPYSIWNNYIPWFLGFFMGQSPDLFYSHHIGMHHSEGNLPKDKSTTLVFQRDSFRDFCIYYFRFLFIGLFDLAAYFRTTNQKKREHFTRLIYRGELLYFALCIGLLFVNWAATLFVFILPLVLVRFGMMSGNWAQHAFVSQDQPTNDYQSSITCLNTAYNRNCFNDGYHIGHHLYPSMHWTDMPGEFLKNQDQYAANRAIVFEGLDYHQIWWYLMWKRYDILAKHFVNVGNVYQSDEEIIAMLRSRTQRFSDTSLAQLAAA